MIVAGTRPELIKLAPLVWELGRSTPLMPVVAATGQQAGLTGRLAADLGVTVQHDLDLHRPGQTLSGVVAAVLAALPPVIDRERPDAIVVQGDTGSALAGALAGFYQRVPVVHLEAGLRTADVGLPFPEEANRRVITRLARLHLAPTPGCVANLRAEGVPDEHIELTGNTVIDALHQTRRTPVAYTDPRVPAWLDGTRPTVLVTMHRRESWAAATRRVARAVGALARAADGPRFIVALHPNPVARAPFQAELGHEPRVLLVEPLTYREMADLLGRVALVLTDSGGLQEEAPALGTPVLILREHTERTEAVAAGAAIVVGSDEQRIQAAVRRLLVDDPALRREMSRPRQIYGDGYAALRAVHAIARLLGLDPVAGAAEPLQLSAT